MPKKSVYLLQNTKETNAELKDKLSGDNYEVVGCGVDDGVVSEIISLNPEFLILELVLSGADGIRIIERVKAENLRTKILVLSALNSESAIDRAVRAGANYFMAKPVQYENLLKVLSEMEVKNNAQERLSGNSTLDEKISKIFINVGIPPHIKGYGFLREGVKMAVNDPPIINNITKRLYPMIGEKFSTTPSKVERAIRHAIEVAWNRGRIESINSILGVRAYVGQEKPTNGEFIALIADKMLLEMA